MEEIVFVLHSIDNTLALIGVVLLLDLLCKDHNGNNSLRKIEDAIKNLADTLKRN